MVVFFQYLLNGLTLGALYALVAIGYTMVYGILKFINFAHGEVMMVGSYLGLLCYQILLRLWPSAPLLSFMGALLGAMLLSMSLGVLIERVAYRPLRNAPRLAPLLSAVGISAVLTSTASLLWGTRSQTFPLPYPDHSFSFLGLRLPLHDLVILLVGLVAMSAMHILVKYSAIGRALRAISMDREMAVLLGVNADRVIAFTFALGSALAALAGILLVMRNSLDPSMGSYYGLKAFIASVIGGIGSIPGAMVGGLLLGVLENFGGALTGSYKDGISFFVLVLILFLRPNGLLEKRQVDKV